MYDFEDINFCLKAEDMFEVGSPAALYITAVKNGEAEMIVERLRHDGEPTYCGGAYVLIRPARGDFVKFCKKNGIGEPGIYGGWEFSVPSSYKGQSQDIREAAAKGVADVLKNNGVRAYVKSYSD